MRLNALELLVCPACRGTLRLDTAPKPENDGHIMAGTLVCTSCSADYQITAGVPLLIRGIVDTIKTETAKRFAEEWTRWSDLRDYYEQEFYDWIAPLTSRDFQGRLVFEGGCGKGRHTSVVAKAGAAAVVAVDLGESAFVAFNNTRRLPNVHVAVADLLAPPVRPVFEIAFSIGVLHHLPDPLRGFVTLSSTVKPGGKVAFWVYGKESNEWITRFVDPIRKNLTSRIPAPVLRTACFVPSLVLWLTIKTLYRPASKVSARLPYNEYFRALYHYPFDEIHANVFDQLVTPVAYYLSEEEVAKWLDGFDEQVLRSHRGYSWTGMATVKPSAA